MLIKGHFKGQLCMLDKIVVFYLIDFVYCLFFVLILLILKSLLLTLNTDTVWNLALLFEADQAHWVVIFNLACACTYAAWNYFRCAAKLWIARKVKYAWNSPRFIHEIVDSARHATLHFRRHVELVWLVEK